MPGNWPAYLLYAHKNCWRKGRTEEWIGGREGGGGGTAEKEVKKKREGGGRGQEKSGLLLEPIPEMWKPGPKEEMGSVHKVQKIVQGSDTKFKLSDLTSIAGVLLILRFIEESQFKDAYEYTPHTLTYSYKKQEIGGNLAGPGCSLVEIVPYITIIIFFLI